jgi:beta-phosphoglucomutase-like phosphatase (HAD superfamily)
VANESHLWGEERIANELLLEWGIRISPRTARKHMPKTATRAARSVEEHGHRSLPAEAARRSAAFEA